MSRILLTLLLLTGLACGGGGPEVDPAPFKAALETYAQQAKYGVKIESFEKLTVSGDTAQGKVRVSHKESTGMKPLWDVNYKKKDGKWVVDSIKRK